MLDHGAIINPPFECGFVDDELQARRLQSSRDARYIMMRETVCVRSELFVVAVAVAILTVGIVDHGGEWPRTWYVAFWLALLANFGLLFRHLAFPQRLRIGTFFPTLMLIGLSLFGVLQTLPLPNDLVRLISPSVTDLYFLAGFDIHSIGRVPFLVDPSMTRASAATLATLALVSLIPLVMSGVRWATLFFLRALTVLGCLVSIDGLLRRYSDLPMLYLGEGFRETEGLEGAQFSWFHHRNDAGFMLNVCFGGALGLLVYRTTDR